MSSESEGILENDLVEAVEPPVPDYVHIFSRMWASIPAELCSGSFPLDVYEDSSLTLPEDKIITMDGVSKCWKTLDPDSDSLLIQEPDGITWAICEECVSQIPKEIQHALYFFHSLLCHVQDFAKYALPSDNILFHKERKRSKVVSKLLWSRVERIPASSVDRDNSDIDMTSEMQQRSTMRDGNIVSEVPALKMRLAVTGARYKHNEQEEKKTFAVLFVTFARNFDGLSYIRDCFLNPVYHPKTDRVPELDLIWKRMICFVAFNNLGLDCNRLRQPENFCDDPCGEMGVDSLMNIFQIPMQIYGAIKNSLDGGVISDVRIAGMPQLRFGRDEMTRDYIEYMHQYIDVVSDFRTKMQKALDKFNVEKKKKDDEEEEEEEPMPELFCIGAWPLACNSQGKFCRWGLPKLPIFMNFEPMFKVEPNERFKYWLVSVDGANGIPELVKTCLRFYMVSVDESVSHIAWDHFLTNRKRANRSLVLQKYYSDRANPMSALVLPGYLREWWFNFKKDIRSDRERGADVLSVCCKFQRYLKSVMLNHKSTMESNAYMSEKITQAASIIEKLNFAQISHEGDDAIMTLFHETMNGMSHSRRHDRYQVCNEMFWRTWENLNRSFKINCSNLAFLMEMMVSRVFWMTGATNETWSAYFQAIQIKSGNGHYRVTNKDGVFDDQRKPNSSGMDFTHARFCELDQAILDRVGCTESQQNLQCPVNCTGWTYASIPLQTHATMSEGKIETLPDENVAYRSFIATEVRDMPIGALIHNFPRNADGLEQFKLNTCDPDKTNKRKSRVQVMIQPLHFVALSTNVPSRNEQQSEEWRTLSAVIATMPPGSGPYTKKQKVGEFNDRVCNVFGSRQSKPERIDLIANVLSYSNIWASCMGALINMSGAITYEINPAVLGYLDWLFYYVREDVNGLLERFVNQSFQRMKEGYEARQVAKSIWTQAIPNIAFAKNSDEAVIKHMHSLMCHTLPVAEVPAAVHSFLCRGINMGAAMMVVVCAKHLQVPIIPLQQLCNFFNQETITSDADQETANVIKLWLDHSKRSNRFCVEDDMFNSMTMYISSDADVSQNPLVDKICMLRVKKSRVQGDNVCQAVGVRVKDLYGLELNETCHMGPEPSIYANGLMCLLGEWMPDFRQLYSKYIYAHERHCKKMRFAEWKASDWDEDECPPFARIFTVRDRANNEVSSYAMGINIWGLLLMVSLGATTLHPQVLFVYFCFYFKVLVITSISRKGCW